MQMKGLPRWYTRSLKSFFVYSYIYCSVTTTLVAVFFITLWEGYGRGGERNGGEGLFPEVEDT